MFDKHTITLTEEQATEGVRRAVEERGADYVYPKPEHATTCLYHDPETGGPGCIVGYVLHYADPEFPLADLAERPLRSVDPRTGEADTLLVSPSVRGLVNTGVVRTDKHVAVALVFAQKEQDRGSSWGHVLEAYEQALRDVQEHTS